MDRKKRNFHAAVLLGLPGAALIAAAAGLWLICWPLPAAAASWAGAALLIAAIGLILCFAALRRTFRQLDELKDVVTDWSSTKPEVLEREITALPGVAGELGGVFYEQMDHMEENLANVERSAREKAERSAEQRIAHEVRDRLLPRALEAYPGRKNYEISGIVKDAKHPGSTYYDYFYIDPGLLCFSVAQLPQNGVPDTLQMVMAQTVLRGRLWVGRSLPEAMSDVNASLYDYGSKTEPVAMLVATLNTWSGQVTLVNAGLPAPLLMRAGEGYNWLDVPVSVPLGQMENVKYRVSELRLHSGNRLLLHTDGLGAMPDREGVPFREQELRTTLNRSNTREEEPEQTLRFLSDEAEAYCGSISDVQDFSALLLEFRKTAAQDHDYTVPASAASIPELLAFLKERLEENGKQPRDYAPLAVLVEELFMLCCRKCGEGSGITMVFAVAPDSQSVTLRFQAPFGGKNPLNPADPGPDGQAAEYITRQAEYVDFQPGTPDDSLTIVWFFAS